MIEDWPGPFDLSDSHVDPPPDEDKTDETCATCGGEGRIDTSSSCTRRISDCCGGCDAPCPDCSGKDERDYDDRDED